MKSTRTNNRYVSAIIWLHWLMFVLIVAVYGTIELREFFPKGSDPRETLKALHFMLGLSVLLFVSLRLVVRLGNHVPPIDPPLPTWQKVTAAVMHSALYAWMIAMPILGWLILSGEAKPIPFFGLEVLPLIGPDKDLAHTFEEIHELLGEAGYWIIGFHAVAGLYHHYVVHDNTLARMSFARR
jgi:cytochrome b561